MTGTKFTRVSYKRRAMWTCIRIQNISFVYICMCVHRFSYELLSLLYKVRLIYLFHDKLSIKLEIVIYILCVIFIILGILSIIFMIRFFGPLYDQIAHHEHCKTKRIIS